MALTQSQEVVQFKFREFHQLHHPKSPAGHAFLQFATSLALQGFQLSESDIQAGITDGPHDGGIDTFHVLLNKTESVSPLTRGLTTNAPPPGVGRGVPFDVVVVQSKSSFDGALDSLAIPQLHEVLEQILSGASIAKLAKFPLNDAVLGQVEAYRKIRRKLIPLDPIRSFKVLIMQPVPEAKITGPNRRGAASLKRMIKGHLGATTDVAVEILSADGIEVLRNSPKDSEGTLRFSSQPLSQKHGKSEAWIGLVSVGDMLSFVRRQNTSVLRDEFFTTNVREFAGSKTPVNSAIRATLATDSDTAFWWMNNGVTIIADRASYQSDNAYLLTNPQIVNGLQTTHVLHEAAEVKSLTAKRRKESLLVRVIGEIDPKVRESIIQGTNNQALVSNVQLYANDALQISIETYLETKGWHYERRRWQYRNVSVSRSKIRTTLELTQAVLAGVFLEPDQARGRPATKLRGTGYARIFDPKRPLSVYSSLLDLHEAVEAHLATPLGQSYSSGVTNDRYFILAAAALRTSGVKSVNDYTVAVVNSRVYVPDAKILGEIHRRLFSLVGSQVDKKKLDSIFKGPDLRSKMIADILKWNATSPPPRKV